MSDGRRTDEPTAEEIALIEVDGIGAGAGPNGLPPTGATAAVAADPAATDARTARESWWDRIREFVRMSRTTATLLIAFVLLSLLYLLVREEPFVRVPPSSPPATSAPAGPEPTGGATSDPAADPATGSSVPGAATSEGAPTGGRSTPTPGGAGDETSVPTGRGGGAGTDTGTGADTGGTDTGTGGTGGGTGAGGATGGAGAPGGADVP